MAIDISVVSPLVYTRGPLRKCAEGWTKRQKLDRERIEVVFVSPGNNRAAEDLARQVMGPQDRLIIADTDNLYSLYDRGIRASRGRIAMITESHCFGGPRVLSDVVELFDDTGCAAMCCRSVSPKNDGYLADMEGALFAEEEKIWGAENGWRRVHERGFAIRRDVYDQFGGFPHEHGWFSGRIFAARLHEAGIEIRYGRHIAILHHNSQQLSDIDAGSKSFAFGEMLFRQREDAAFIEKYFGRSVEFEGRDELRSDVARSLLRVHLARSSRRSLADAAWRSELRRLLVTSLLGVHWPLARARLALWYGRARFAALRPYGPQAGLDTFRDLWHNRMVRYHRLRYLRDRADDAPSAAADHIDAERGHWFIRFHDLERHNGVAWRWSQPMAAVRLRFPARRPAILTLTAAAIGEPLPTRELALYLDGVRLSPLEFSDDGFRVSAAIDDRHDAGGVHTLAIVCDPLHAPGDTRALGIPLRSIELA